ncbi:thiopeptide-type bacteriocin biosynthesis protein [Streptomyces sp. B4I13]|uniref:thiopeptide-type bacteriocin biosynthesis protein n=1 Tax=Streptomyces sp. B4I13 TaxID=3042271 RepID=UPI00277F5CA6|nr:thiopeptide-type bacteriocin biosynthesis protein [Streptomyces sp. B4I13]MDQ0958589.1 thiopeptide-type bacteriocin biosynthesis protein [Streptomyces sp. B4I13]
MRGGPATGCWESVHLHDHGDQDALVTGLLRPLVAELSPHLAGFFFIRYWEGGPHIRLRLRVGADADGAVVRQTVRDRARSYFLGRDRAAAERRFDAADWVVLQRVFAELEGTNPADTTELVPDGSIVSSAYHPETGKYGGEAGVALAENVFFRSSELVLEALPWARQSESRRLSAGLAAVRTVLDAAGWAEREARAFLTAYGDYWSGYAPARLRRQWPRRAHEHVWDACPEWQGQEAWQAALADAVAAVRRPDSDVPHALAPERGMTRDPVWFLLCHFLHTHNNRLGVPPWEEAYVAFAASRA